MSKTVDFIQHHKPKVYFNWRVRRFSDRKIIEMPTWNQNIEHNFDGRIFLVLYDEKGYLTSVPQKISRKRAIKILLSYRKWFQQKSEIYSSFRKK